MTAPGKTYANIPIRTPVPVMAKTAPFADLFYKLVKLKLMNWTKRGSVKAH